MRILISLLTKAIILLTFVSLAKADGDVVFQIGSSTVKQSVSDADMQRVINHAVKAYTDVDMPLTSDEAMQRMMNDIIVSIFGNVVSGEKANAAKTAIDAVASIEIKPKADDGDVVVPADPD